MKNFKNIISENRKKLNITQRQLADKINVSDKQISKWETGVSYPDITMLNSLAKALEISINELLESDELKVQDTNESTDYDLLKEIKKTTIVSLSLVIFSILLFLIASLIGRYYDLAGIMLVVLSFICLFISVMYLLLTNNNEKNKISLKISDNIYMKNYYYKNVLFVLIIIIPLLFLLVTFKYSYIILKSLSFNDIVVNSSLLIILILLEVTSLLRRRLNIDVKFKNVNKILNFSGLIVFFLIVLNTILINIYSKHVYNYDYLYKYFYYLNRVAKLFLSIHITGKISMIFLFEKE